MEYRRIQIPAIICALISMLMVSSLHAQESQAPDNTKRVSSRVVDQDGRAVEGITVTAVKAKTEAVTGRDGAFSIRVSNEGDRIVIDDPAYKRKAVNISDDFPIRQSLKVQKKYIVGGDNNIALPYDNSLTENQSVSAISTISGKELESYPTSNVLEALAGRIPGLVVQQGNTMPGQVSVGLSVRGEAASVYVDGIERDASNLSAYEIEKIQVIKDYSGRAALGVSGSGPVIWITTKRGHENNEINAVAEYGLNTPTVLPKYLGSYDYAKLYNEALTNDGLTPIYDQQALDAYKQGSSARYPNVDYYNQYVKDFAPYRHADVNFSGAKNGVDYFALLDYNGSAGFENVGRQIKSERVKLRGNLDFPINDWIKMGVRVFGSYQKDTFPNVGGSAGIYDMFSQVLSQYPSNAHPITYEDSLIVSNDYPTNLNNELIYGGHGESSNINSQNDVDLLIDLNRYVEGLTFKGFASFNIYNTIGIGKGGTAALYRLAGDSLEIVQQQQVDPDMALGNDVQTTRTVGAAQLNYNRTFGKNQLKVDGSFFRGYYEGGQYQPEQLMDLSLRANYSYDRRYVLQLDVTRTGSMRLPKGHRFNTYPTVGIGWVASNESFLADNNFVNYLKFYSSLGQMGVNNFYTPFGFNPYYLYRTTWQTAGTWFAGIPGSSSTTPITTISQAGNKNIELPKRTFFNAGVHSRLLNNSLSIEFNYFKRKNTGILSPRQNVTSALAGGGSFLPAVNFAENEQWGVDGLIQYSNHIGKISYSIGANALYMRGKYLKVDEAPALADYRKRAGRDSDLFWLYQADGLFQSQSEINSRNVSQSWGDVQPGDIKYVDYNGDGVVDQKDIHTTGAHSPRVFYGLNLSLGYKGIGLYVEGVGVADGQVELTSNRYFRINGTHQNYSKLMLDRYPKTNKYPRLTTSSENNIQNSTFWLRNAAYFRIKNIELSYNLPTNRIGSGLPNHFKIFVRGKNLFVWSKLSDYSVDPANMNAGIYSYPMIETVTAGLSVQL